MTLMHSRLLKYALYFISISAAFTVGFSAIASADAVSGTDDTEGIASLTDRWLRYRAIAGCYSTQDVGKISIDKVTAGTWFQRDGLDYNVATGYTTGGGDRKVSCGDGSFVTNSLDRIGFSSNIVSFCSMSVAIRGDSKEYDTCINGPGEFDMDGSTSDQYNSFKDAKAENVSDSPLFPYDRGDDATKKILYWVGRQTLIQACGGDRDGPYDDSMEGNVRDSKRKVVVNEIDLATGNMERYVYNLSRDETDTINDVWSGTGNGGASVINSEDLTCAELAQLTWSNDDAFGEFVKKYIEQTDDVGSGIDDGNGGTAGESTTSCDVDGIGWLICPVMTLMGKLNDAAFGFINGFLQVEPRLLTDPDTEAAWKTFRDIANGAFVVAFIIIIYSQMTGMGVSNYGLKKLIPRVIAAAILVNLSYYITQIAVDLSNIVGSGIYDIFKGIATTSSNTDVGGWEEVVGFILAGAGALIVGLLLLLAISPAALLAFGLILLILIARKAMLILLVVVSPLAFVAYLLPNTEDWFRKWWKAFSALLMVFPVVGVIFGASTLAARIVNNAGGNNAGSDDAILLQITALGIMAVPLFAVPLVLKGALSAAGSVGGKIAGWQDKANSRAAQGVKNGRLGEAKSAFDKRRAENRVNRRLNGGYVGKGRLGQRLAAYGEQRAEDGKRGGTILQAIGAPGKSIDDSKFARTLGADAGKASAVAAQHKFNAEQVENSIALLQHGDAATLVERAKAQLITANSAGDVTAARAATKVLATQTGSRGIQRLNDAITEIESSSTGLHGEVGENIKVDISSAGLKPKDRALDLWSRDERQKQGVSSLSQYNTDGFTATSLNETELAGQSGAQLKMLAESGAMTQAQAKAVLSANAKGTIALDPGKLATFQARASAVDTKAQPILNRDQVASMGLENAQSFVASKGGVGNLSDGDLLTIRNVHGSEALGQGARNELIRRGLVDEKPPKNLP